ncbi:hypothetical protein BDW22DRAFT_344230 [Trametopsis cervina]|nr:hypothetical protein BDW22DRAFT_344230 [Trametopsis cervina]
MMRTVLVMIAFEQTFYRAGSHASCAAYMDGGVRAAACLFAVRSLFVSSCHCCVRRVLTASLCRDFTQASLALHLSRTSPSLGLTLAPALDSDLEPHSKLELVEPEMVAAGAPIAVGLSQAGADAGLMAGRSTMSSPLSPFCASPSAASSASSAYGGGPLTPYSNTPLGPASASANVKISFRAGDWL